MKKGRASPLCPLSCVADRDQCMKPRWLLPPLPPGLWFIDCRKLLLPLLLTIRLVVLNCGRVLFCTCTLFTGLLLIFAPLLIRIGLFWVGRLTGFVSMLVPP